MYAVVMNVSPSINEPVLLLVSGAPGSGKTTLAELLSQRIGLYHVERDKLKFGIEFGKGYSPLERKNTVVPTYFKAVTALLELGISCIADGAHFRGKTEDDLTSFRNKATVLNIHCNTTDSTDRARRRDEERDKTHPDWAEKYEPDYKAMYSETANPVEHGYELLEVDCTNGYEPNLEEIIKWVYEQTGLEPK